ncbi:LysR family transcriptional regulator [Parapusillimonas granuli]|uniref:LysR family transcriptional regulator n=1 Tax=Parapusillimonas granuli TaxID=380911 RepID=A0A853FYM6_9BURK|nr:LysR family transcriptional regulator [Parapusillimonas granuli]MBB5215335.1 DNA-binding transcriptional LysR family regulator [Parapusillimonas granuli]MEB2400175.1 LysR family transcriptional regulator [Alcaligenaceae bacterium]NYT49998.1 LysR family transcriptional regulator [Parapusillimonas granuli]
MNTSLRQLQGFVLVAKLGSFTRAAEQLHITQAGLSSMIRDLEAQFGCRLFDRTTRSVSLTPAGANLVASANLIISEMLLAKTRVTAASAQERRLLKVAVTQVVAASLMPHVENAFARIQPMVQLRVFDVAQGQIQTLVETGEADIGFSIYRKPSTSIETREVIRFPMLYIAPKGLLSAPGGPRGAALSLHWNDIPDIPLISLAAEFPLQQSIDAALGASGRSFTPRGAYNSMQTMIAMVAAGHGAALLPSVIEPLCDLRRVDIARVVEDSVMQPYYQIWKRGRRLPDIVTPFVNAFKEVAYELCSR